MKKILISTRDLNVGGVQKSLVEFLFQLKPEIDSGEYKVDLLVLSADGELKKEIDPNIKIIEANKKFKKFGLSNKESKGYGKGLFLCRAATAMFSKIFSNRLPLKFALKAQNNLGDYDVAISYAISISGKSMYVGWSELVLEKCSAKKKIAYIHNDFVSSALNNKNSLRLLRKFDEIWFVSHSCEKSFIEHFKEFDGKTEYLYNFLDIDGICKKSEEKCEIKHNNCMNFISVSRLSNEKGYMRMLQVFKRIKDDGYKFFWHIVGDGPERNKIEENIAKFGLSDFVKLYGMQSNPYCYIKNSDLLLLGSYNESFGLVLVEAMVLKVPVLSTNTLSAQEIVGKFGVVCENSEESIYDELVKFLNYKEKVEKYKRNLLKYDYDNGAVKSKLLSLLNDKKIEKIFGAKYEKSDVGFRNASRSNKDVSACQ